MIRKILDRLNQENGTSFTDIEDAIAAGWEKDILILLLVALDSYFA
jgi:hypothetical protein